MSELSINIINKPPEGDSFLQQMLLNKQQDQHMESMGILSEMLERLKSMDSHTTTHHAGGG
jgi:hypothetical protein